MTGNVAYTKTVILYINNIPASGSGDVSYTAPEGWFIFSAGIKGVADESPHIFVNNFMNSGVDFYASVLNFGDTEEESVRFQIYMISIGDLKLLSVPSS